MNINNLKIENHGIISIITKAYIGSRIVHGIVEANLNKKIMVWEDSNEYYPCERVQLSFTTNLKGLLLDDYNFDLLIINRFAEWCNTKETIEFLKYIKKCEFLKNKSIVILFSPKKDIKLNEREVKFDDCKIFKDVIQEVSDTIYLFNRNEDYLTCKLQDKNGNILSNWGNIRLTMFRVDNCNNRFIPAYNLPKFIGEQLYGSYTKIFFFKSLFNTYKSNRIKEVCDFLINKQFNAKYLNAEELINEYLNSFEMGEDQSNLLNKYNQYDVVFIDDFQLLKGKIDYIKYVHDIIENLYKNNKYVIIISECELEDIKCELEDIKIGLSYSFYDKTNKYIIEYDEYSKTPTEYVILCTDGDINVKDC